jgi:hypothetical protein
MEYDHINAAELAWRAGINRRSAKSSAWNRGATFRENGDRVINEREGEKIAARARFAQRVAKRHDRHNEQIADSLPKGSEEAREVHVLASKLWEEIRNRRHGTPAQVDEIRTSWMQEANRVLGRSIALKASIWLTAEPKTASFP